MVVREPLPLLYLRQYNKLSWPSAYNGEEEGYLV